MKRYNVVERMIKLDLRYFLGMYFGVIWGHIVHFRRAQAFIGEGMNVRAWFLGPVMNWPCCLTGARSQYRFMSTYQEVSDADQ